MKAILIFIFAIFILSFKIGEDKKYKVELTLQEWQFVLQVVDQSNAPHSQVKTVQELIIPQLNKQIADTTKKK